MSSENIHRGALSLDSDFRKTLDDLRSSKISLPNPGSINGIDFSGMTFPSAGELKVKLNDIKKLKLDPYKGRKMYFNFRPLMAYDESILTYEALEGTAVLTAHSIIDLQDSDYLPFIRVTLKFYSRAKNISINRTSFVYATDPSAEWKRDYAQDRNAFIQNTVGDNSILLIDGPLLGGQMSQQTVSLNDKLLDRGILPIFLVKNSSSDLVRNQFPDLQDRYNSDMHWAYSFLSAGERTSELLYQDEYNPNFGKVFFYLKAFDLSPVRIEVHKRTFEKFGESVISCLDCIYFALIAQGDLKNPQVRPIAIAEKFAREVVRYLDSNSIFRTTKLNPTMNQTRFG